MAEKSTTAPTEDTGTAVPKARTADQEPATDPGPPRKRATKATAEPTAEPAPAAKSIGGDAGGGAPREKRASRAAAPAKKAAKSAAKKATKSAKAAKKATEKAAPAKNAAAETPPPVPVPAPGRDVAEPAVWAVAAWEAVRRPDRPPQRLAELAVAEIGPRAAAWAGWLRETYPGAPADGIVRLATRQAGRLARAVALAGAGGPVTAPLCLPAAGWVRASVVLRVAAAYGHDPTDPKRAGELVELLGLEPADGLTGVLRRLRFVRFLGSPLRLRRSPVMGPLRVLAAISEQGDGVERLAHRAAHYYRARSSTVASASSSSPPNAW